MRLSRSVRRLAPSLCILATVSFPGQAQTAPNDDNVGATVRNPPITTADALGEGDPSLQVRAPMLEPEQVGEGELELIEPRAPDHGWKKSAVRAAATGRAEGEVRNEQGAGDGPVVALSAAPSAAAPLEDVEKSPNAGDISQHWPQYGLIASLMLAAIFLFWRLGERARLSDYGLIGHTASSAGEEETHDAEADGDVSSSDGHPGSTVHESLKDAVRAMKTAPRATRPGRGLG